LQFSIAAKELAGSNSSAIAIYKLLDLLTMTKTFSFVYN